MRIAVITAWYPNRLNHLEGTFVQDQVEVLKREHDVEVFHLPALPRVPQLLNDLAFTFWCSKRFRAAHRRKPFELIHAHTCAVAGWLAVTLGGRFGLPVVITEHSSPFSLQTTLTRKGSCRAAMLHADAVLAVSERVRARSGSVWSMTRTTGSDQGGATFR